MYPLEIEDEEINELLYLAEAIPNEKVLAMFLRNPKACMASLMAVGRDYAVAKYQIDTGADHEKN